ncbi:hypothetical protein ACFOSW_32475 [Paenibacillus sp. GCM10012303]
MVQNYSVFQAAALDERTLVRSPDAPKRLQPVCGKNSGLQR